MVPGKIGNKQNMIPPFPPLAKVDMFTAKESLNGPCLHISSKIFPAGVNRFP